MYNIVCSQYFKKTISEPDVPPNAHIYPFDEIFDMGSYHVWWPWPWWYSYALKLFPLFCPHFNKLPINPAMISVIIACFMFQGTIAYVPQQAWIQNMTLRDNILFGKDYTHNKYWKIIENCCLKSDLAMMDFGDKTELGEKVGALKSGTHCKGLIVQCVK